MIAAVRAAIEARVTQQWKKPPWGGFFSAGENRNRGLTPKRNLVTALTARGWQNRST
jgi:hypothetical protein